MQERPYENLGSNMYANFLVILKSKHVYKQFRQKYKLISFYATF